MEASFPFRVSPDLNYRVHNDGTDFYSHVNALIYTDNLKILDRPSQPKITCSAASIGNTVLTNSCNGHSTSATSNTVSSFHDEFKYSSIESTDSDSLSATSPSASSSSDDKLPQITFSKKVRKQHKVAAPCQNDLSNKNSTYVGLGSLSQIPGFNAIATVLDSQNSSPVKLAPSKFNLGHSHKQGANSFRYRLITHEESRDMAKSEPRNAMPIFSSATTSLLLINTASQISTSVLLKPSKFVHGPPHVSASVKQDVIVDQTLSSKSVKSSNGHPQAVSVNCSKITRRPVPSLATETVSNNNHIKSTENSMQQTQIFVENISFKRATPVLQQMLQSVTTVTPIASLPAPVLEDPITSMKTQVLQLFPNVNPHYLDCLCRQFIGFTALNDICFILTETNYPKLAQNVAAVIEKSNEADTLDYYHAYMSIPVQDNLIPKYVEQVFQLLAQEFIWLSAHDIRNIMQMYKQRYAPSHQQLTSIWKQVNDVAVKKSTNFNPQVSYQGLILEAQLSDDIYHDISSPQTFPQRRYSLCLLENKRPVVKQKYDLLKELQREVDFVKQKLADNAVEADHQVAATINDQEYEVEGQCIECGCCYEEYPFEKIVQCYDGHLFCDSCLVLYVREVVFGQGKVDLKCMTDLCGASFPKSQLTKALPIEILKKYEDRVTEENLNMADFGDLVRCPHCDFRAFMDPLDKVLRCQAEKCRKETCRYCQVDWTEHFGKRCNEIEQNDETKLRLQYEEKMTKAKVRTCHQCKAQFMKEDGCNKMTCRCGAKMCYICRSPDINYKHFCQHLREPGHGCSLCNVCNLWTNPAEDDDRAVKEIQKEALEDRKNRGFMEDRLIGVPDIEEPPTKRAKK